MNDGAYTTSDATAPFFAWWLRNPHSILKQFDQWFDFECRARGLKGDSELVATWTTA